MNTHDSLTDVFQHACNHYATNPAYSALGHTLTFSELNTLSRHFAAWLQNKSGLQPGDRIAIQLPNLLQYPVVAFAALRAGLVLVNTNPLYTHQELRYQLQDCGAKALVVLANFAYQAASIISETDVKQVIITQVADLHPYPKLLAINFTIKWIKKAIPPFKFSHSNTFLDVIEAGKTLEILPLVCKKNDVAVLQYTGGTTGIAKGAMLTHENLIVNMNQVKERLPAVFEDGANTYCAPLPLYHIYSFNLHLLCSMSSGNHSVLVPNPHDINSLVKVFNRYPITGFMSINTLYNALLNNVNFKKANLRHLKYCSAGGMAMMADTAQRWCKLTQCEILEGYGLTETSPVVAINAIGKVLAGSVGTALLGTQVKIIDCKGKKLPSNHVGELCVRGPQVMKGYWQNPEETANALSEDGWFSTGDIATINEAGYIKIVDRIKDMISVSGFKVFPNEIENIATLHPAINECAAIGIPCEKTGEAIKLIIVKNSLDLTAEDIKTFCRQYLTAYKIPKVIEFTDKLPKSNIGKVLRRELN